MTHRFIYKDEKVVEALELKHEDSKASEPELGEEGKEDLRGDLATILVSGQASTLIKVKRACFVILILLLKHLTLPSFVSSILSVCFETKFLSALQLNAKFLTVPAFLTRTGICPPKH